jgi:hypothetical protein
MPFKSTKDPPLDIFAWKFPAIIRYSTRALVMTFCTVNDRPCAISILAIVRISRGFVMELSMRTVKWIYGNRNQHISRTVATAKIFRCPRSVERCQAEITNEFERKVTGRETRLSPTLHASIHAKNQYATLPTAVSAARAWKLIGDHRVLYLDGNTRMIFCPERPWPDRFPVCELDVSKPSPQLIRHSALSVFKELSFGLTRVCLVRNENVQIEWEYFHRNIAFAWLL